VFRELALTWANKVLHRIHRTYYYDVPIYLENTKPSSKCPARGRLKRGIINRGKQDDIRRQVQ
jgi:hypothetical protein